MTPQCELIELISNLIEQVNRERELVDPYYAALRKEQREKEAKEKLEEELSLPQGLGRSFRAKERIDAITPDMYLSGKPTVFLPDWMEPFLQEHGIGYKKCQNPSPICNLKITY